MLEFLLQMVASVQSEELKEMWSHLATKRLIQPEAELLSRLSPSGLVVGFSCLKHSLVVF